MLRGLKGLLPKTSGVEFLGLILNEFRGLIGLNAAELRGLPGMTFVTLPLGLGIKDARGLKGMPERPTSARLGLIRRAFSGEEGDPNGEVGGGEEGGETVAGEEEGEGEEDDEERGERTTTGRAEVEVYVVIDMADSGTAKDVIWREEPLLGMPILEPVVDVLLLGTSVVEEEGEVVLDKPLLLLLFSLPLLADVPRLSGGTEKTEWGEGNEGLADVEVGEDKRAEGGVIGMGATMGA